MLRYEARTDATPQTVWTLMACPTRWSEWAPHVRGAWGLGWRQVREGALGAAKLWGVAPVPAKVTRVDPGESWAWQVGLVTIDHRVEALPDDEGAVIAITMDAPGPLEGLLERTYGPIDERLIRRLAQVSDDAIALGH